MLADLFLDLALLSAILALGSLLTYLLLGGGDLLWIAALAFPIGSGVLTWLVFLASWIGLPVDLVTVAFLCLGVAVVCLFFIHRSRRGGTTASVERGSVLSDLGPVSRWLALLLGIVAGLWLMANLFLSVERSYSLWDAIAIWSVKGYGISLEGSIFAAAKWGAHGLAYPLHLPLLISLFDLAGGDLLPGSKMIFPLYFASLLVGVFGFSRRIGLGTDVSLLSVLCLGSIPVLFTESTSGYANAPLTVYLALGGLTVLEGGLAGSIRKLVLGGLLLGLAGWTRVEGAIYAVVILGAAMGVLAIAGGRRAPWGWAVAPMALLWAPWFSFYRQYGAETSQAVGALTKALEAIRHGEFHLGALRLVFGQAAGSLTDVGSWGWIWILAALLAALGFRGAARHTRLGFLAMVWMAAATVAVTISLFYLGSFGTPGLRGWLDRSFDRALLPSPVLLFLGAIWLVGRARSPGETGPGKAAAPVPGMETHP